MTCIAAVRTADGVTMGGDSAGVAGLDITVRADAKVFRNGPYLVGFAGSFRQGQVLRYAFTPPEPAPDDDLMRFMVTRFIGDVRACLEQAGVQQKDKQVETAPGLFLVAYKDRLFRIDHDYQVGESLDDFEAIGSGHSCARGSLYTTSPTFYADTALPIAAPDEKQRVHMALSAAAHLNGGVCKPFTILSST